MKTYETPEFNMRSSVTNSEIKVNPLNQSKEKRWGFTKKEVDEWNDFQCRVTAALEKDGYKTMYCVRQMVKRDLGGYDVMTVKILAHNGYYILSKNSNHLYSARSYTDVVNWAKTNGYIDSRKIYDQVHLKRSKAPTTPATQPSPTTRPQRSTSSFGRYRDLEIR